MRLKLTISPMEVALMFADNEPDEGGVWHMTEGWTQDDGSIRVVSSTNDNKDRGYPSEHARWEARHKDREQFLRWYGRSRTGCMGARVTVTLDGKEDY